MSVSMHNKVIDEISESGKNVTRFIRYSGDGEPLIHPKISELIKYARSKLDIPIALTTNGSFLTESRILSLIAAGVTMFDVSIDAVKQDTYEKIRIGGKFLEVVENTKNLVNLTTNTKVTVAVSFVKQELNQGEEESFRRFWSNNGVKNIIIRNGHSAAGAIKSKSDELWASAPSKRKPCLYPWERLVIKADGEVTYCPVDWHHIAGIGSIESSSISDIWQSKDMNDLRSAHNSGDFTKHSFCAKCPDWSVIKWPTEGRSYATLMHEIAEE